MKKFLVIIILLLFHPNALALDRCQSLVSRVRAEHIKYFGISFPYWYGVGQLKQESCCRASATAFDKGMGVAQFMPKTSQYIQSLIGEKLDPYNPTHAIRMQAFYMKRIHVKENWSKDKVLWVDYQIYNGGRKLLYKEFQCAGVLDWDLMRTCTNRKKIKFKWGILDLGLSNYDYSEKVKFYGNQYRRGPDGMRYR